MEKFELNASMCLRPQVTPASAWTGHIPFAAWLVEELRPVRLVELGTHNGASYLGFCQAVRENKLSTECFAVDTWKGDEHAGYYGDEVFSTLWEYNQKHYAGFSQLLRMTFDEAVTCFDDGSIDLLHIDGLHTYEAVRHDFETWLPKLSHRGVILFHDTVVRERNFGVWKLWEEISSQYPSFEFQHTHGLGVLLVGSDLPVSLGFLGDARGEVASRIDRLFETLGRGVKTSALAESLDAQVAECQIQLAHNAATLEEREAQLRRGAETLRENEELVGHLRQGLTDRERELATNSQQAIACEETLVQLNKVIAEKDNELATYRDNVGQKLEAMTSFMERIDGLATSVALHASEVGAIRTELVERDNTLQSLANALDEKERALGVAREKLASSEANRGLLERIGDELRTHLADALPRIESLEAQLDAGRARLESSQEHCRQLEAFLANERKRSEGLEKRLAGIDAELSIVLGSRSWRLTRPLRWLRKWNG